MADFVESAKNFVSSAVSRTSWEAQKQMRVRGKQGEIDKLVDQRRRLLDDLGTQAMTLYQQGMLSDPQLSRICASIMELDHDLRERETQLQEVKKEAYQEPAQPPTTNYSPPPFTSPSQPPQPTSASTGSPSPQAQGTVICPTCGSTVRANALYCRSCGAKLR